MLLHFIFVIKEEDLPHRKDEFEYVKSMAKFFQKWIKENFSLSYEIQCDEMIQNLVVFSKNLILIPC